VDFHLVGSTDCGTYVREKILIGSGTDDTIPAYVLVPNGIVEPAAAVFCHHQHAGNFKLGKSEVVGLEGDPDQAYAAELAARWLHRLRPGCHRIRRAQLERRR
jgi:hypothetical protein